MAGQRKSAEERREEIVGHALRHFAQGGYHGTSTEAIARDAGISQPYLFRLFKTKRELFLTCNDVSNERILDTFRAAAARPSPAARWRRWARPTSQLLGDRDRLLFQMQSYAACSDPVIQERVRAGYGDIVREVTRALRGAAREGLAVLRHGDAAERRSRRSTCRRSPRRTPGRPRGASRAS